MLHVVMLLLCWPAEHLDGVAVQHAAALAPVISSLQEEITALKRELDQQRLQAAVTQQELEGMTSRVGEVCALRALLMYSRRTGSVSETV